MLLRHAKSAYPTGVRDHDRPLSDRGGRDAVAAGPVLRSRVDRLDLAIVSSAHRAQQTWTSVASAWPRPPHHTTDERIYEAWVDDLLLLLREVSDSVNTLALVGHNPGFEELAFSLASESSDRTARETMGKKFPTSGLATFSVTTSWARLVHGCADLTSFDVPRG